MTEDIFLVNLFKEVTDAMKVVKPPTPSVVPVVEPVIPAPLPEYFKINYEPGRHADIIKSLIDDDNSTSFKDEKYPLIAAILPNIESYGTGLRFVRIERIVIAHYSKEYSDVLPRFGIGETYESVLYPCYREFLKRLAWSKWTSQGDPDAFIHKVKANPGRQPIGEGTNDHVDTLEILGLEFYLNQIKTC